MSCVREGRAATALVTAMQATGALYRYRPADLATNAHLIRTWVLNGAPANR
jgi:hypothetical protein